MNLYLYICDLVNQPVNFPFNVFFYVQLVPNYIVILNQKVNQVLILSLSLVLFFACSTTNFNRDLFGVKSNVPI